MSAGNHPKMSLKRKGKPLLLDEVICPICREIFLEPVTLPCQHSVCRFCLERTVAFNCLTCPICRTRIGNFLRQAKTMEQLIDNRLWERLKNEFTDSVRRRVASQEDGVLNEFFTSQRTSVHLCKRGAIKREFDDMLRKFKIEEKKRRVIIKEDEEARVKLAQDALEEELKGVDREIIKYERVTEPSSNGLLYHSSETVDVENGRDSITSEFRHFTPICIVPQTPPKVLPDGQFKGTVILKPTNLTTHLSERPIPTPKVQNVTPLKVSSNNFTRMRKSNDENDCGRCPRHQHRDSSTLQKRLDQEKRDLKLAQRLHAKWNRGGGLVNSQKKHGYSLRSVSKEKRPTF